MCMHYGVHVCSCVRACVCEWGWVSATICFLVGCKTTTLRPIALLSQALTLSNGVILDRSAGAVSATSVGASTSGAGLCRSAVMAPSTAAVAKGAWRQGAGRIWQVVSPGRWFWAPLLLPNSCRYIKSIAAYLVLTAVYLQAAPWDFPPSFPIYSSVGHFLPSCMSVCAG